MYQPLVADLSKMKEYREKLAVAIFLASLQLAVNLEDRYLVPTLFPHSSRPSHEFYMSLLVLRLPLLLQIRRRWHHPREDMELEVLVDVDVVVTVASVTIVVVATTLLTDVGISLDGLLWHILHHLTHLP